MTSTLRFGIFADSMLAGSADIDFNHDSVYEANCKLDSRPSTSTPPGAAGADQPLLHPPGATPRGLQDGGVEEVDEMLTQNCLLVMFGSPVRSVFDSVVDELTFHLPHADSLAPDYLGAYR